MLFSAMVFTAGCALFAAPEAALPPLLLKHEPFAEYLKASGEPVPDFDAMPSEAPLPLPLHPLVDGARRDITTPEAWRAERARMMGLLQHWILGSVPPAPDNLEAEVLSESTEPSGVRVREVNLRFGPEHKAHLWAKLYLPPGPGPFPVFMTQDNHNGWALIAVRRGYLACVYAGADSRDDTASFLEAWPEYDFSKLCRRGWAAGRCLDYLETVPEADAKKAVLTGHSRNGKSSLMGSALDERFAAVISSSSGVGGCMPSRLCGEHQFAEGIENITRAFIDWFHPRWRFFAGREHKAPADLHHLVAMSAPRPCLLSIAFSDDVEHGWAMQHTYRAVKPVYELLGAPGNVSILWREAGHETAPAVIEKYLDWCDYHLRGRGAPVPERLPFPWDWDGWRANAGGLPEIPTADDGAGMPALRAAVEGMMGEAPPQASTANMTYGVQAPHVQALFNRGDLIPGVEKETVVFGEYINLDIYAPKGTVKAGKKIPAILWLGPHAIPGGYNPSYRRGEPPHKNLARAGYAVCCFDAVGTGARVLEIEGFYDRHPGWSLLGKMARDARAALDAMAEIPYIDTGNVWAVGYAQGALLALHVAALDNRIAGLALAAPPLPFRLDTDEMETGGVRRWAQESLLLPRLGLYAGAEQTVPYDLDQICAAFAPKPLVVLHPVFDRFAPAAPFAAFRKTVAGAYAAANAGDRFVVAEPDTYNQFDEDTQQVLLEAMAPFSGAKTGKKGD
ncbi:MAG: hypothetical protein GXY15_04195 [Candidatus Hydrogenedentes bacterium]|nr:hypothetical protein [Candidatus Hydrogenedentota bacterium]